MRSFYLFICVLLFTSHVQDNNSVITDCQVVARGIMPAQGKKEIPVLCYHNIKELTPQKSPAYTIDPQQFRSHIKMLADKGYNTILPDELYEYLVHDAPLPPNPVMITFDDTHEEHFSIAAPILTRFNFKAVFFPMAVTIGKPGYMTEAQIKALSDNAHVIGCHTLDHPNVKKLTGDNWRLQISKPKQRLELITGKPVQYFAYPFGAWNETAIDELKQRGIKGAFQLSDKQNGKNPVYTIRRLMVGGNWSPETLNKKIHSTFY